MGRLVVEARGTAAEGPIVQAVAAVTQSTWAYGRYIFVLAVTRGADQGQTVCAVFVH
jgi:hypothetical protein